MRALAGGLLALTLARLAVAAVLPLTPDEAYYWVWSRAPQASYLDHPPMVAWWIAAGTALGGEGPLGIRLLGPPGLALASLALARAGDLLFPESRPGAWGAVLFNATPMVNAGAVLMTPDTPLLVFWCLALLAAARVARGEGRGWWGVGAASGAALLSKYTAGLLGVGLLLWLALSPGARRWWRHPALWGGGALALLIASPVVWWNASNGWASLAKQGGRAGAGEGWTLRYLGELLAGQAALASPLILMAMLLGLAAAGRMARRGHAGAGLVLALTLPGALLFLGQASGSRVQGNWPAVLYPAACLAAALAARWRRPAAWVGAAVTAAVLVQALLSPLPLPRGADPTLARLAGWPALVEAVEAARREAGAGFVAAEEYGLAALLALHLPPGVAVVALDARWAFFDRPAPPPGVEGLLVRSARRGGAPLWPGAAPWGEPLVRGRDGIAAETYRLHRATTPPGAVPHVLLPRPRAAP